MSAGGTGSVGPRRIAVIGAGISGLAAAREILRRGGPGVAVTVFEAGARAGGVIQTIRDPARGLVLEEGPDCFISTKPAATELCEAIGLGGQMIGTRPEHRRSFIMHRGKLKPIPEGFFLLAPTSLRALAATPLLSVGGKLRAAMDLFMPAFAGLDARPVDAEKHDESLASFVRRRFGKEVLERIAQPMVGGIYTADPEKLSLAATFPQFLAMEREHGSVVRALAAQRRKKGSAGGAATVEGAEKAAGPRYGMFVSLRDGMAALPEALVRGLPEGCLRLNSRVTRVEKIAAADGRGARWRVLVEGEAAEEYDALCVALPAHAAARVLGEVDAGLAHAVGQVTYASCAIVNLVWPRATVKHALDGMGFVVPAAEGRRVLACSFSTSKWEGRAPADTAVFRVFMGGAMQEAVLEADDDELARIAAEELTPLIGASGAPTLSTVSRWPRAMAQYHVGHVALAARIRGLEAAHPTLALAGNAFDGVGIPDCIRQAKLAAARLVPQQA